MTYNPRLLKVSGAAALLLVFLFAGLISAPASYAASPVVVGGKATIANTDGDTIRVREGAGTDNEQIAEAYEGQAVSVLAGPRKDAEGTTWYKISGPGGTGWIMSIFLAGKAESTEAGQSEASAKPADAPPAPKLVGFARVANTDGDPLRVRSASGTNGGVLTMLDPGTSVAIKAGPVVDSTGITWYHVSANGVTGWAMAQYLVQAKAPIVPAVEAKPEVQKVTQAPAPAAAAPAPAAPAAQSPAAPVVAVAPEVPAPAAPAAQPEAAPAVQAASVAPEVVPAVQAAQAAPAPAAPVAAPAAPQAPENNEAVRDTTAAPEAPVATRGNLVVNNAMKYVGYRYRFGGSSPSGFDCSGFVYYIVNKSGGKVGRTIPYQINSGPRIARGDLQPGDMVFFSNTYKRGLSHAGIYIGNGKFIHAQNERTGVIVSSLNTSYWSSHYTGATRPR